MVFAIIFKIEASLLLVVFVWHTTETTVSLQMFDFSPSD